MSSNLCEASAAASPSTEATNTEAMVFTGTSIARFHWKVVGFRSQMKQMCLSYNESQKWRLEFRHRRSSLGEAYFSIFLVRCKRYRAAVGGVFPLLYVLNAENEKVRLYYTGEIIYKHDSKESEDRWELSECISYKWLTNETNGLLPNDELTILCEIFDKKPFEIPVCQLAEDLSGRFESAEFSDLTFVVDGREIPVHKIILAARCSVFASIFATKSETPNRMEVSAVSYEVFKELLRFVYCGKVTNMAVHAERLLVAADKYKLWRLKALCEMSLSETIGIRNAGQLLVISDDYNADQLKDRAIDFISRHSLELKDNDEFQNTLCAKPLLVFEAFNRLADRHRKMLAN